MSEEALGGEASSSTATSTEHTASASHVEASSQPNASSAAQAATSTQPNASTPPLPAQPGQYVPNFKFKFADPNNPKQQEKEFDDWAKALIKDAQTEKSMRDLYEKGFGIDSIKSTRDHLRGQLEKVSQEHAGLSKYVQNAMTSVQKGDYQSFFEQLKIPEQAIFRWVHDRIQFMQKPAHEQQAQNQLRQQQMQMQQLQEQNQQMQSVAEQYAVHMRTNEMESYLARPDLASFAQQYDQRVGQGGAFRRAVIERGQFHSRMSGKDIAPAQAINEVLQLLGAIAPQGQPAPVQNASPQMQPGTEQVSDNPAQGDANQARAKPTITNVRGQAGASPVKKTPRSLADLRKLAKDVA